MVTPTKIISNKPSMAGGNEARRQFLLGNKILKRSRNFLNQKSQRRTNHQCHDKNRRQNSRILPNN